MSPSSSRRSTTRDPRSAAEWVTFAVACVLLVGVLGVILLKTGDQDIPPRLTAVVSGPVRGTLGGYEVPVEVTNEGGMTAADVQVLVELERGGEVLDGDQVIDFVAGGEVTDLVFVFPDDPREGALTVRITGYATP